MEILLLRYKAEYLSNIPTLGPASLSLYQHYLPLCLFINITNWTLKHTNHWDFIKTEIADRLTQWSLLSDCYKAVSDDTEKKVTWCFVNNKHRERKQSIPDSYLSGVESYTGSQSVSSYIRHPMRISQRNWHIRTLIMTHLPASLEAAAARISLNHILDNGALVWAAPGSISRPGLKHRLFISLNFYHLRSDDDRDMPVWRSEYVSLGSGRGVGSENWNSCGL